MTCHSSAFGGNDEIQKKCVECHGDELRHAEDSHPKRLFTDPRNFDQVELIDARSCLPCHREHKPDITRAIGVTVPNDFCMLCHDDIETERPTHKGLSIESCAAGGCHNYHDNAALYEDYLVGHLNEPAVLQNALIPITGVEQTGLATGFVRAVNKAPTYPLPVDKHLPDSILAQWKESVHAIEVGDCMICHAAPEGNSERASWDDQPGYDTCKRCHVYEVEGFLKSRYGMRLPQKLSHMRPGLARQPMNHEMGNVKLDCSTCHDPHTLSLEQSDVEVCMSCHTDRHSLSYPNSEHFRLLQMERAGRAAAGSGVSCATCHMPRTRYEHNGVVKVRAEHNLNDNLRPNEKMIRTVCVHCHGVGFAIDALADEKLVRSNFIGLPKDKIKTLDMVAQRKRQSQARRHLNREK